jgi:hypothetical protein
MDLSNKSRQWIWANMCALRAYTHPSGHTLVYTYTIGTLRGTLRLRLRLHLGRRIN